MLVLIAALALSACDNSVQPLVEGAEGQFSVFGHLDSAADTQFVRLEPVLIAPGAPRPSLNRTLVITTDDQGQEQEWTYRAQTLEDGTIGDVWFSEFRPIPGHTYLLEALSAEGVSVTARASIPQAPRLAPGLPRGDTLTLMQNVRLLGQDLDPLRLTVLYDVRLPDEEFPSRVPVDYGKGNGPSGEGWGLDVFLRRDQATVLASLNRAVTDRGVTLVQIGVRAELLSPEWSSPAPLPANISNGRGFFGAIGRYDLTWSLTSDAVERMGFLDGQ